MTEKKNIPNKKSGNSQPRSVTDFHEWHIQKVTKGNFSLIPGESMAGESQPVARAPGNAVSVCPGRGCRAEGASSPFLPNLADNGLKDCKRHPLPVSQVLT